MTWLLILAIIGLTLVLGVVFLELLIRWVSLARVQTAAKEASLVYARDMVRLRDNCLSLANSKDLTLQSAGIAESCNQTGGGACPCTPLKGQAASIPGALTMEYLNASQTLLYNIWGKRIADPKEVDDVQQSQCYKPYSDQRFSKIQSPEPTCVVTGKVTSPITDLKWEFKANPYGTGLCCASGSASDNAKDFCVDVRVTGRMDPIMAGGLPFLSAKGIFDPAASVANGRNPMRPVRFITIGDFEIHARAVVNKMSSKESTGDDGLTQNLSGETIQLEDIPKGATCASAPQVVPITPNPLTPPTPGALSLPPLPPLPPSEIDPSAPPIDPGLDPTPPVVPNCPYGFSLGNIINRSSLAVDYICNPCPAAGSIQSQGAQTCSGNSVVRTDTMNNGNCGTYPQTVTVANCGNGCSNGACSPPPPPPAPPSPPTPTPGAANAQCAAYKATINQAIAKVKADYEDCLRPSAKNYYMTCLASATQKASIYQTFKTAAIGTKSIEGFGEGGGTYGNSSNFACTKDACAYSPLPWTTTPIAQGARIAVFANSQVTDMFNAPGIFYKGNEPECISLLDLIAQNANMLGRIATPIVISLEVKSTPPKLNLNGVQFKFFNTLKSDLITWPDFSNPRIGFLVVDLNKNGLIDNSEELFGNMTAGKHFANGYEALSDLYDSNKDGKIDSSEMKDLLFWNDKNQNGISEKGELKNINQLGIMNIFLDKQHIQFKQVRIPGGQIFPSGEGNVQIQSKGKIYSANSWDFWLEEIQ